MKGLPLSSFSYSSMQQIFLMPACLMIFAQLKHGQQVVQSLQPSVLPMPTSMMADYSACRHRHWSSCFPSLLLHRSQPNLQQEGMFLGVPLQPVEITLFSKLTMTAPTEVFMQFDLLLAMSAIFMKYWSQVGRKQRITSFSFRLSSSFSCSLPVFNNLTLTSYRQRSYSSLWNFSSMSMNSLIASTLSPTCFSLRKLAKRCLQLASTRTMFRQFRFLSSRRISTLYSLVRRTAFGVSRYYLQQISLMYFLVERCYGFSERFTRKVGMLQSEESSSATSSMPEQGSPMRKMRSTYSLEESCSSINKYGPQLQWGAKKDGLRERKGRERGERQSGVKQRYQGKSRRNVADRPWQIYRQSAESFGDRRGIAYEMDEFLRILQQNQRQMGNFSEKEEDIQAAKGNEMESNPERGRRSGPNYREAETMKILSRFSKRVDGKEELSMVYEQDEISSIVTEADQYSITSFTLDTDQAQSVLYLRRARDLPDMQVAKRSALTPRELKFFLSQINNEAV